MVNMKVCVYAYIYIYIYIYDGVAMKVLKFLFLLGVKVGFSIRQHIAMHWLEIDLCV